jgi:hypothetical protein
MKEADFAYRVRQALNEGLVHMDYKTTLRLEQARRAALARQRPTEAQTVRVPAARWATAGGPSLEVEVTGSAWLWMQRLGLVAPLLALLVGFIGIYEWQNRQLIEEIANIDTAVLLDEGPIDAYADRGFGVLLKHEDTQ